MRVKICGIQTLDDARAAIQAGADMLGFNFYPLSPRCLEVDACQKLIAALRAEQVNAILVGVFVNVPPAQILETMYYCHLDLAQLSGDESAETLRMLGDRAFKALRLAPDMHLTEVVTRYPARSVAPAWLVDAYRPGEFGGTGQVADWSVAAGLARQAPLLLAGGLTPQNVTAAITQVKPWGVDVASGVESAPGIKDQEKLRLFIQRAKQ